MKTIIEIHEHNTIESGYYKVWFDYEGKTNTRLCSEALVNSFLSMRQKEDFFMGVYRFGIKEYDFMLLVNSQPFDKLTHKHERQIIN